MISTRLDKDLGLVIELSYMNSWSENIEGLIYSSKGSSPNITTLTLKKAGTEEKEHIISFSNDAKQKEFEDLLMKREVNKASVHFYKFCTSDKPLVLVWNAFAQVGSRIEMRRDAEEKRAVDSFKKQCTHQSNRQIHNTLKSSGFFNSKDNLRKDSYRAACTSTHDKYVNFLMEKTNLHRVR